MLAYSARMRLHKVDHPLCAGVAAGTASMAAAARGSSLHPASGTRSTTYKRASKHTMSNTSCASLLLVLRTKAAHNLQTFGH